MFILECPNLFATDAIETPAYNKIEAWVCLKPWILIIGILAFLHLLANVSFIVELNIFSLKIKIGLFFQDC